MAIRYVDNSREKLSVDLHAFFAPFGTTDKLFDEWCGWVQGRTREILDKVADPSWPELIEICMRMAHPLGYYVQVVDQDGADRPTQLAKHECTTATPCCPNRLLRPSRTNRFSRSYCPHDCDCHQTVEGG